MSELLATGKPARLSTRVRERIGTGFDYAEAAERPVYLVDLPKVQRNLGILRSYFSDTPIFYAVKANADQRILQTLGDEGASFETASLGEVRRLIGIGVTPERIIYGNPCVSTQRARALLDLGVSQFAVESLEGLRRMSDVTDQATLMLRLNLCEYDERHIDYGATLRYIETQIAPATELATRIRGLCFYGLHELGLEIAATVKERWLPHVETVNLGGALLYPELIEELDGENVTGAFNAFRHQVREFGLRYDVRFQLEPGSALVNNAVHAFAHVLYSSTSGHYGLAVHVDLSPSLGLRKFVPGVYSRRANAVTAPKGHIYDPTCSKKRIASFQPCPLFEEGEVLLFPNVGMYSLGYISQFHLLDQPEFVYWAADETAYPEGLKPVPLAAGRSLGQLGSLR